MAMERSISVFWGALVFEAGLGLVGWGLGQATGQSWEWGGRGWGWSFGLGLLATIPLVVGFAVILQSRWAPLVRLREMMELALRPVFAEWSVVQLGAIALAAGVGEELLFRGFLQTYLSNGMSSWGALIVASVVFGLAHPLSVAYGAVVAVIGVYLGGLFMVTRDLAVPMVAHALYDGIALVWFLRGSHGRTPVPDRTATGR